MWRHVLGLALLFCAAVALPNVASAQSCTTKCECYTSGCGCFSEGGNGCKCSASGGGCFVTACGNQACDQTEEDEEDLELVLFAPDGSPVRVAARSDRAPHATAEAAMSGRRAVAGAGNQRPFAGWEMSAPGVAVQRNCEGIVIRRAYAGSTISIVYASTRRVTL
jgi:hypothetical protein